MISTNLEIIERKSSKKKRILIANDLEEQLSGRCTIYKILRKRRKAFFGEKIMKRVYFMYYSKVDLTKFYHC